MQQRIPLKSCTQAAPVSRTLHHRAPLPMPEMREVIRPSGSHENPCHFCSLYRGRESAVPGVQEEVQPQRSYAPPPQHALPESEGAMHSLRQELYSPGSPQESHGSITRRRFVQAHQEKEVLKEPTAAAATAETRRACQSCGEH